MEYIGFSKGKQLELRTSFESFQKHFPDYASANWDEVKIVCTRRKLIHPQTGDRIQGLTYSNGLILLAHMSGTFVTVSTFIHECVHFSQFATGRLTDYCFVDMSGRKYPDPYDREYPPHESEADMIETEFMTLHYWKD